METFQEYVKVLKGDRARVKESKRRYPPNVEPIIFCLLERRKLR
jgi:hypothetical protein